MKICSHFSKPDKRSRRYVHVKIDLSKYAAKVDLKTATDVDTTKLALRSDLASLKVELGRIDVDELITFSTDFSKLSNGCTLKIRKNRF